MTYFNETKNQHFVSQAELRLNSINSEDEEKKQKIYSFEVTDRESFQSKICSENGDNINKSLSINDLFIFDVLNKKHRLNFENIFSEYESQITNNTNSLLDKVNAKSNDINEEIINLFIAKFMNFTRNPYCIEKVLNSLTPLQEVMPILEPQKNDFERLLQGHKPQQSYICESLGITSRQYINWLGTLFMLLTNFKDGAPNFIEEFVINLFTDPNKIVIVYIYTYENHSCVLSDRGHTIPLEDEGHMAFDFNLNANSFIRYVFVELPEDTPQKIIDSYKSSKKYIRIKLFKNDLETLQTYNQRTLYQCHHRIYSSTTTNYGL